MSRRSKPSSVLSLLGLAQRAGAVVRGGEATRRAIQKGQARLVVMAEDASPAQLEKILKTMTQRSLPGGYVPSRAQLGGALGAGPLSAVAITKASFATQVSQAMRSAGESFVDPKSR